MHEEKRKDKEISFKKEAKIKHNNKYLYDNVYFVNKTTKVDIACPIHGHFL